MSFMAAAKKKSRSKRVRRKATSSSENSTDEGTARQTKSPVAKTPKKKTVSEDEPPTLQDKKKKKLAVLTPEQEAAIEAFTKSIPTENVTDKLLTEYEALEALNETLEGKHVKCCEPASKERNRFPEDIFCLDETRIVLQPSADGKPLTTDFIHANKIVIDKVDRQYIAAQVPKEEYIEDFWSMVFQENSTTVVVFGTFFEKGKQSFEKFWPAEVGAYQYYGKMFLNNKKVENVDMMVVYTLELLPEGCSNSLICRLAHMQTWKEKTVDTTKRVMRVCHWSRESDGGPITCVCTSGVGRTGTFITTDAVVNRLFKAGVETKVIDIATSVRKQRALAIDNSVQYITIYLHVLEYTLTKRPQYESLVKTFKKCLAEKNK